MKRLAQYVFWISAAFHFALYPLSLAAIAFGFWRLGFWHGLVGALMVTVLAVLLKMAMAAFFSMVITLLDPDFFS
ncbi:MAG: hypothetical protein ACLQJF_05880 [Candidatus Sulfotelmatobacter sp.]|jgi:hypothetical protein